MIYECDCGKKIEISKILETSKIYFGCDNCGAQLQIRRKPSLEVFKVQHKIGLSHKNRMASVLETLFEGQPLFLKRKYNEKGNLSVTVFVTDSSKETFKEILCLKEIRYNEEV